MPHALANNLVHCVFSTKNRAALILDLEGTRRYLSGIARSQKVPLLVTGGTANHMHLLLAVPPAMPLAEVIKKLKGNSSRWLNEHKSGFAWQEGYGAFSVSQSQRERVIQYISSQEQHHQKWSFEQEFRALLHKSGVACDPRYIFG